MAFLMQVVYFTLIGCIEIHSTSLIVFVCSVAINQTYWEGYSIVIFQIIKSCNELAIVIAMKLVFNP